MSTHRTHAAHAGEASGTIASETLARVIAEGFRHYRRWRTRRALSALSDHMLRDIGLTRGDVLAHRFTRESSGE